MDEEWFSWSGAGRILGLDRYIEELDVVGEALTERYPKLNYILG